MPYTLKLKPEQDGLGYFNGQAVNSDDGDSLRIDILPPKTFKHSWGVTSIAKEAMHEKNWIAFITGDNIAKASTRADLEKLLLDKLNGM